MTEGREGTWVGEPGWEKGKPLEPEENVDGTCEPLMPPRALKPHQFLMAVWPGAPSTGL